MRKLLTLFWLLSCISNAIAQSTVITVGPGAIAGLPARDYTDICTAIANATASTSGDPANFSRIDIDGATSGGQQIVYYDNNCQYSKSIHLNGVGALRPALDKTAGFVVGNGALHGYLRPSDGHQILTNLEARNSRCGSNCTVIWPETTNVDSFTLDNVFFHSNDDNFITHNQVMTSSDRTVMVTITNSEFSHGGIWDQQGQAHCIYVGEVHTLTFRNNYVHDCFNGQGLKSRAGVNYVINNRFRDRRSSGYATSSTTNLEVDFPNGGLVHFVGNIVEQGENVPPPGLPNGNAHIVQLAGEKTDRDIAGAVNEIQEFLFTYNTFTSRRASAVFIRDNRPDTTTLRIIKNNIFAASSPTAIYWEGNPGSAQSDPADNSIYSSIAAANFVDGTGFDLRLGASSTAKDAAVTIGSVGTAPYAMTHETGTQYAHPRSEITRTAVNGTYDNGALEDTINGTAYIEAPYAEIQNGPNTVRVHWGQAIHENNPPTGYKVYRDATLVTTAAANVEYYDDTGGTPGQAYYYTVVAAGSPDSAVSNARLAGSQRPASSSIGTGTGWHFISNSNYATNACTPAGNCSTHWSSFYATAAWDPTGRRILMFGGDPTTRNKNGIYAFDTAVNLTWGKLNSDDADADVGEYVDSGTRPGQRAVWGGLAWIDTTSQLFMYGGYFAGSTYSTRTWEWTESGDTWSDVSSGFDLGADLGTAAYRASNGKVWLQAQDSNLREYNPADNTYSIVKTGVSAFYYARILVSAESVNKLFYVGAGHLSWFNLASSYAQTTVTSPSCEVNTIQAYPAVDFDSSTNKLVFWNKADTITLYDPATDTCSSQTIVGEPISSGQFPSNGFRYDATRNGFWAVFNNGNVAFLRLSAASTSGGRRGGGAFSGGGNRR